MAVLSGTSGRLRVALERTQAAGDDLTGAMQRGVGLSQLTTSRQHGAPALRATRVGADGFRLDGEIPWVTGADQARAVVMGAVLDDGAQVLFVLPTDRPGVTVEGVSGLKPVFRPDGRITAGN